MSEIAQAEQIITEAMRIRGGKARGADILKHASYRLPLTVVHGAYWGLIQDGKLLLDGGVVRLA